MELLKHVLRVAAIVAAALSLAAPAAAGPSEQEVKAAYLLNFARYVTWPESAFETPDAPLRICVVGNEEFRALLEKIIAGKTVGERPVQAASRRSADAAVDCHVAFLNSDAPVAALSGSSVFTVSSRPGFAARGGVANFVRAGARIRFEINAGAASAAGLQVSSRLLRLAQVVD